MQQHSFMMIRTTHGNAARIWPILRVVNVSLPSRIIPGFAGASHATGRSAPYSICKHGLLRWESAGSIYSVCSLHGQYAGNVGMERFTSEA